MNTDVEILLWFNGSGSFILDSIAMTLTNALTWIPLYLGMLYVVIRNNETMAQIGLVIACVALALLLTGGVDNLLVKPYFQRLRPINDPEVSQYLYILPGLYTKTYSFFSSHATNTFAIATFISLLVRSRRLTVAMAVFAMANCWTRLYLGMHYPSDIVVGAVWGIFMSTLVYFLYLFLCRRWSLHTRFISAQYTSSGYLVSDATMIVNILLLTLLYAVIHALF